MTSIFDAISSALNEAMRQQAAPPQQAQEPQQVQYRQPDPVQTGRPQSQTQTPSFSDLLAGSGFGSLAGLVEKLSNGGLDQHVKSWLGTGENIPVQPDQLRNAIGQEPAQTMSQQTGIPAERILQILAQYLPTAIDRASPNGRLQDPNQATH
jgi:uncharacterized protein YidB (DUF937 family)